MARLPIEGIRASMITLGFAADTPLATRRRVTLALLLAVVAISTAAPLVRAIDGMSPSVIAFWRTSGAALLLAPAIRPVRTRDALWVAFAGVCLAGHFVAWFSSLEHTTVLRSTVLVCMNPVWVGLMEWGLFRRRPSVSYWSGVGLAVVGVAAMAGSEMDNGRLYGDALALLGGLSGAIYFVIGRTVRPSVSFGSYAALVCAAAAAVLLLGIVASGDPLVGFEREAWLLLLVLAAGPQLLGHNGFNYALRYVPATTVSTLTLLEPVGAGLLALAFFAEWPPPLAVVGSLFVVAGVFVANR